MVIQRIVFAAEAAKIALSSAPSTRVRIPCIAQRDGAFVDLDCELTRERFEELSVPLVERAASACDDVLARAKLTAAQVDELVLVGGQTRMPAVRARMTHFKRFSSEKDVQPELGVAIGAAILGRNLARGVTPGLSDVSPMPISAMLPGGGTRELIPTNAPVPSLRRLELESLPLAAAPIPVVLFESVDATSIEREVLGTVMVEPQWRRTRGASLVLELGADFTLRTRFEAEGVPPANAPIVEPRAG